jgi:Fe-S-cluster-containing dehydrogenase component
MKVTRREFVKRTAQAVFGIVVFTGAPAALLRSIRGIEAAPKPATDGFAWAEEWTKHRWAFVVDTTKCIGCGRCVVACKTENDVPMEPEFTRTWVERYVVTEEGEIFVDSPEAGMYGFQTDAANAKYRSLRIQKTFFVPKLCNQCEAPPCVQVCPVAATYKTQDGVILIDRKRCIGCRYCIQACPYGARFLDPRMRVADKCTWCYHRITKGLPPACVEACPVGARVFGDLRDPESPVRRLLRENRVSVLKPSLGTRPKVFYIGLEEGVR